MATKPASTYILNTASSLYSDLVGCWPMLEGSGTTTADKTTGSNTATLTGGLTWGTPDSEGPNFQASTGTEYLSLASNLTIPVNTSFSIAWGCYNSSTGSNGMVTGDVIDSGQNFVWMQGSNQSCEIWCSLTNSSAQSFPSLNNLAARHDYLLTAAYSSGTYTINLYQDGTAATPITGVTAGTTAWKINALLNGYSSSGYSFYGQFEYLYVWSGRALAHSDATTLSVVGGGNPYSILKAGSSASFTVAPTAIPANHAGSITLSLTGTGTSWTSGSSVSVQNSVTGTTTVTKGTWMQSSSTAATLTVTTGPGTGTFTITVDGVVGPALTVDTASFITFNLALGNIQSVTLSSNSTLVFSGAAVGQQFTLNLQQAASGGPYSLTWPATASVPYGTGITWMTPTYAAPPMPATASGVITLSFLCTGSGAYLGYYCGQSAS
jgi:hypothetical protein